MLKSIINKWHWILLIVINIYLIIDFVYTSPISISSQENIEASSLLFNKAVFSRKQATYGVVEELIERIIYRGNRHEEVEIGKTANKVNNGFKKVYSKLDDKIRYLQELKGWEAEMQFTCGEIDTMLVSILVLVEGLKIPEYSRLKSDYDKAYISDIYSSIEDDFFSSMELPEHTSRPIILQQMLLVSFSMHFYEIERRAILLLADSVGTHELSFTEFNPEGIMAQRGSRSKAISLLDTISFINEVIENEFISIDVMETDFLYPSKSKASYSALKLAVANGTTPAPTEIQINELVNFFNYELPSKEGHKITISHEVQPCPWNKNNYLIMIGLQGINGEADKVVAADLNIEISFLKSAISSYRFLGQEGEYFDYLEPQPFNFTANQSFIMLYEVSLQANFTGDAELADLRLSYRDVQLDEPFTTTNTIGYYHEQALSSNFSFIASVAETGLVLRDSRFKAEARLVTAMARINNLRPGLTDQQQEFLAMIDLIHEASIIVF